MAGVILRLPCRSHVSHGSLLEVSTHRDVRHTCVKVLDSVSVVDNSSLWVLSLLLVAAWEKVRDCSLEVPVVLSVPCAQFR